MKHRDRLPRPKSGYIPRLRGATMVKGSLLASASAMPDTTTTIWLRVRATESLGRSRRWTARASVWPQQPSAETTPTSCGILASAVPLMGFAASAGLAQALTGKDTDRANMPSSQRVRIDEVAPFAPPFLVSVVDDVWAVEAVALGRRDELGPAWLADVDRAWAPRSRAKVAKAAQPRPAETAPGPRIVESAAGQEAGAVLLLCCGPTGLGSLAAAVAEELRAAGLPWKVQRGEAMAGADFDLSRPNWPIRPGVSDSRGPRTRCLRRTAGGYLVLRPKRCWLPAALSAPRGAAAALSTVERSTKAPDGPRIPRLPCASSSLSDLENGRRVGSMVSSQ